MGPQADFDMPSSAAAQVRIFLSKALVLALCCCSTTRLGQMDLVQIGHQDAMHVHLHVGLHRTLGYRFLEKHTMPKGH